MRERVSGPFSQWVFWSCLAMGVTVSGLTNFWGGMALISVAFAVALLRVWPSVWRRLQGQPGQPVPPTVDTAPASWGTVFRTYGKTDITLEQSRVSGFPNVLDARGPTTFRTKNTEITRAAAPAPAPSGPTIGRNAPCPCGSGKKFKKCHGAKQSGSK